MVLNKGSDVTVFIHGTTNNVLSSPSNYIVDVAKWLNFDYFSTFMREVIITQILCRFDQKKPTFLNGWSWFKSSNLRPVLAMVLKFYRSVEKRLKLRVKGVEEN